MSDTIMLELGARPGFMPYIVRDSLENMRAMFAEFRALGVPYQFRGFSDWMGGTYSADDMLALVQ